MKTSFFCCQRLNLRKNGRRICSINDVLTSVDTLGTPQTIFSRGGHHDA